MDKKNMKDQLSSLLYSWRDAVMGKEGFAKALIALAILVVASIAVFAIVSIISVVLPVVTTITIVSVLIAISALALAPTVIKYLSTASFLQKNREKFVVAQQENFTLATSSTSIKQINLSASFAKITINFSSLPEISADISIDKTPASSVSYLWDETDDQLTFKQGSSSKVTNSPLYSLTLNIPFERKDLSINARLIEGSLTINSEGDLDTLKIEAVNSSITLINGSFNSCKLYGLNLLVNTDQIRVNSLVIRSTGDNFNFAFKDDNRGAKLKTNTALSVFKVDNLSIGKSFSHGLLELWPAVSSDDGYMDFEFNTISATVNITKPKAID